MTIIQKDNPILRKVSEKIPVKEITSKKIQNIISQMKEDLSSQDDGVAIAAPQIGENVRIFVMSGKVTRIMELKGGDEEDESDEVYDKEFSEADYPFTVFINPEIIKSSRKKIPMEEGCLSVRYLYGKVPRSEKVTIKAHDDKGSLITRGASGLMAQVFQHEIDHLNGVLFIDKAQDVKEILPEDKSKK